MSMISDAVLPDGDSKADEGLLSLCEDLGFVENQEFVPGFDYNSKVTPPFEYTFSFDSKKESKKRARSHGTSDLFSLLDQPSLDYLDLSFPDLNSENQIKPAFNNVNKENDENLSSFSLLNEAFNAKPENFKVPTQSLPEAKGSGIKMSFSTSFLPQYWRNDRKNLQCFPFCPEYGDYYLVKTKELKHTKSGGTCGTSVKASLSYERDDVHKLLVFGRITRFDVPSLDSKPFISEREYQEYKKGLVPASIAISDVKCFYELSFHTSVWKFEMQLSKARRSAGGPPRLPDYFFEAVLLLKVEGGYKVLSRAASSRFLISSTRTLHRATLANNVESSSVSIASKSPTRQPVSPPVVPMNEPQNNFFNFAVEPQQMRKRLRMEVAQHSRAPAASAPDLEEQVPVASVMTNETSLQAHIASMESTSGINQTEVWLWSLLFGIFGGHYFYLNRPKKGILYALTFGCFLVGYFVDLLTIPFIVSRAKSRVAASCFDFKPLDRVFVTEAYILALFFGVFGFHRFYLGHPLRGCLYLLTFGLLGCGVLVDLFDMKELVKAENERREEKYAEENSVEALQVLKSLNEKHPPKC